MTLAAASDSGVQGDDLTNVTTPTLTGSGAAGDTVTLIDGTTAIGTASVAGDGTWSITTGTLVDGTHDLTATQADSSGDVSAPSATLALTIDTAAPPAPSNLALAPASDSGVQGDGITNVANPVITGSAEPGTTVTLYDGTTPVGTSTADPATGAFSISTGSPLGEGANSLTATSTDAAGNSATSGGLTVTLDTTPPTVTETLDADGITVDGTGDPNAAVTISNGTQVVGTANANAAGAWTFDTASLTPDTYSLVASETDAAGNTGSSAPLAVTVPARFDVTDTITSASTLLRGSDYPGPVDYLDAGYNYTGTDTSVISALVGSVFMHSGSAGEDAEVALSGSNVLASGSSSSWLVGTSGADGGDDTFFLSNQGSQQTWDTLVNFHVGDMLTLWDFNSAAGSTTSVGTQGANGGEGETLSVNFGNGSDASTLVTFAGVSPSAQFSTTSGSTAGHDFLMLTRTA